MQGSTNNRYVDSDNSNIHYSSEVCIFYFMSLKPTTVQQIADGWAIFQLREQGVTIRDISIRLGISVTVVRTRQQFFRKWVRDQAIDKRTTPESILDEIERRGVNDYLGVKVSPNREAAQNALIDPDPLIPFAPFQGRTHAEREKIGLEYQIQQAREMSEAWCICHETITPTAVKLEQVPISPKNIDWEKGTVKFLGQDRLTSELVPDYKNRKLGLDLLMKLTGTDSGLMMEAVMRLRTLELTAKKLESDHSKDDKSKLDPSKKITFRPV